MHFICGFILAGARRVRVRVRVCRACLSWARRRGPLSHALSACPWGGSERRVLTPSDKDTEPHRTALKQPS